MIFWKRLFGNQASQTESHVAPSESTEQRESLKNRSHLCLRFSPNYIGGETADWMECFVDSIDRGKCILTLELMDHVPRGLSLRNEVVNVACRYDDSMPLLSHLEEHAFRELWYVTYQRYGSRRIALSEKLTELGDPLNPIDNLRLIDRVNDLLGETGFEFIDPR